MNNTPLSLPEIEGYIEKALKDWGIPGGALLLWKDGKVLSCRGFGVRELGMPEPVDGNTIFNIASSTKAFTAACLGLLVDEGKLDWDDPVVKFLPGFKLYDPWITREVTLRDLLSHHLGLKRYNRVSLRNEPFNIDEFLLHFPYMEPSVAFRTRFSYGNEQYVLASKVIEVVSGKPYDAFLQDRLFTPLGMISTFPSLSHLQAAGEANISRGHCNLDGGFVPAGVRLLDPVQALPLGDIGKNAAGCIWSNMQDLALWLELFLGKGTFRGKTLLSPQVMEELCAPQVSIAPGDEDLTTIFDAVNVDVHMMAYAFGWYVMDYRGRKLVVHGGNYLNGNNVIGFLPGENLGFVIFVNTYHVIAHILLSFYLLDACFGEEIDYSARGLEAARIWQAGATQAVNGFLSTRTPGTHPSLSLEQYAGVYTSPLLGELRITLEAGELLFSYGNTHHFDACLQHWQDDTFVVHYKNNLTDPEFLVFEPGLKEKATALTWLDSSFSEIGRMECLP